MLIRRGDFCLSWCQKYLQKMQSEPVTAKAVSMKLRKKLFTISAVSLCICWGEVIFKNNMTLMLNLNCKGSLSLRQVPLQSFAVIFKCLAGQTEQCTEAFTEASSSKCSAAQTNGKNVLYAIWFLVLCFCPIF